MPSDTIDMKQVVKGYIQGSKRKYPQLRNLKDEDVWRIIAIESQFNPEAVNPHSGAQGLMQVKEETADWMRAKHKLPAQVDPQDISENILSGMLYFQWLKDRYRKGGMKAALQAYNLGHGAYDRGKRRPSYVRRFNKVEVE